MFLERDAECNHWRVSTDRCVSLGRGFRRVDATQEEIQCALAGFDWGLRAACITSILHPEMVKGFVVIGGYSVQNTIDKEEPAAAIREARMWYQWYFNTEQGRVGLEQNRRRILAV